MNDPIDFELDSDYIKALIEAITGKKWDYSTPSAEDPETPSGSSKNTTDSHKK